MMPWSELNFIMLCALAVLFVAISAFVYTQVLRCLDVLRDVQIGLARYLDWQMNQGRFRPPPEGTKQ